MFFRQKQMAYHAKPDKPAVPKNQRTSDGRLENDINMSQPFSES